MIAIIIYLSGVIATGYITWTQLLKYQDEFTLGDLMLITTISLTSWAGFFVLSAIFYHDTVIYRKKKK